MAARPLTPLMLAVLQAVADDETAAAAHAIEYDHFNSWAGAAPNSIGRRVNRTLGLEPPRRLGNGAVSGSWSGSQADCQRVLGPLGALVRRELLYRIIDRSHGYAASRYYLSGEGRAALAAAC